jgi:hypothetical protein
MNLQVASRVGPARETHVLRQFAFGENRRILRSPLGDIPGDDLHPAVPACARPAAYAHEIDIEFPGAVQQCPIRGEAAATPDGLKIDVEQLRLSPLHGKASRRPPIIGIPSYIAFALKWEPKGLE